MKCHSKSVSNQIGENKSEPNEYNSKNIDHNSFWLINIELMILNVFDETKGTYLHTCVNKPG